MRGTGTIVEMVKAHDPTADHDTLALVAEQYHPKNRGCSCNGTSD